MKKLFFTLNLFYLLLIFFHVNNIFSYECDIQSCKKNYSHDNVFNEMTTSTPGNVNELPHSEANVVAPPVATDLFPSYFVLPPLPFPSVFCPLPPICQDADRLIFGYPPPSINTAIYHRLSTAEK